MSQPSLLLPTAWFPSIEYFALLAVVPHITVEIHESYPKQTCRNRCYIATANKVMPLSVPVIKTDGNHTITSRIAVSYSEPWQRNHWRTIESAYRNSAWYIHYADELHHIVNMKYPSLVEMNHMVIKHVSKTMRLDVDYQNTDRWNSSPDDCIDLRGSFDDTHSIFSHDQGLFPSYFQNFADRYGFQANLSILDLLFNCGPEAGDYLKTLGEKLLHRLLDPA